MDTGIAYLEENLLPLFLSLNSPCTDSYTMIAAGLGDKISSASVLNQVGNKLETFFNKVTSDTDGVDNLIEESDRIVVNGKKRQIDILMKLYPGANRKLLAKIFYLECKCNLEFDSEKRPASNLKVKEVTSTLEELYGHEVSSGYFVPTLRTIPDKVKKKYSEFNIYGVEWFLETINCTLFTVDEYFTFFKEVLGPILEEKMGL